MRPLCLVDPEDPVGWAIADSYMLGPSLWVAPVLEEGAAERRAYLPRGEWFDCWSGERLEGGRWIEAEAPLERIPLWVRAGSLVVSYPEAEVARGLGEEARRQARKVTLEEVFQRASEGRLKELNIVLKADVSGSLEALEDEIAKLPQEQVPVNVIHAQTGGINESDVMLASASDAVIIGFNVRPLADARRAAEEEGVDIRTYTVIYKVTEDLRAAMEGLLEPEEVEESVGQAEIKQTFKASRVGTIAGCLVTDGKVTRTAGVRLVRDGTIVWTGKVGSLRRFKDDVAEVDEGQECGIVLEGFADVKEGDVLEFFETRQVEKTLE
jgi:translation initiation factor IF-2